MKILFEGELMADYHQIYIADVLSDPNVPIDWPAEILSRRLNVGPGILVFTTARNMPVPVRVELHRAEPGPAIEAADHVVTGGLRTSGMIVVAGLTDYRPTAARAVVPAGDLRAMVVSRGLGTLSEDGLDGADRYVVHLWPGPSAGISVLKQWDEA